MRLSAFECCICHSSAHMACLRELARRPPISQRNSPRATSSELHGHRLAVNEQLRESQVQCRRHLRAVLHQPKNESAARGQRLYTDRLAELLQVLEQCTALQRIPVRQWQTQLGRLRCHASFTMRGAYPVRDPYESQV